MLPFVIVAGIVGGVHLERGERIQVLLVAGAVVSLGFGLVVGVAQSSGATGAGAAAFAAVNFVIGVALGYAVSTVYQQVRG